MKFDKNNIDGLLDKYWDGASTLAEEAVLRQYFSSDSVHEEHSPYASLFQHFTVQREMSTDLQVESVLKAISSPPKKQSAFMRLIKRPSFTMGIAAALTLMLSVVTLMDTQMPGNTVVLDEKEETEEAMRVTKQALALLSGKINDSSKLVNRNVKKVGSASIIK